MADRFNQFKLVLISLVVLSGTFHTMLLFVDARISPDAPEILTEMTCSPAGTSLQFTIAPSMNASCHNVAENRMEGENFQEPKIWSGTLNPSDCKLVNCSPLQQEGILEVCNNQFDGDKSCKQIPLDSQRTLDLKFKMSTDYLNEGSNESEDGQNCTAKIVANGAKFIRGGNSTSSSTFLCRPCSIQCLMRIKMVSTKEKELEDAAIQKEADRSKHQRGFWIYFMFRIVASSTLAATFSMLANFPLITTSI